MRCKIVYDQPGRLRVRAGREVFDAEQGCGIEARLLADPATLSAEATPVNGGILVHYRPGCRERVLELIDGLDRHSLPVSRPLDVHHMRALDSAFLLALARIFGRHSLKKLLPAPLRALMTLYSAMKFWKKGVEALQNGRINVDVLDASAILAAAATGDFDTASSIMMLLRVSELLEDYTKKRTRHSLKSSLALNIDGVWLDRGDGPVLTPLDRVAVGDILHVRAGGVIPLDGEVAGGDALVNEASMTGEPHGVQRMPGDSVYAGTVVEEGSLAVRVRALAGDTRIQSILALIDHSESLKAGIQSKAERLADSIVPFSFLAAAVTLALTRSFIRAAAVLMVDYSCAIKLTTPISIISAMHEASGRRILVKGGKHLEAFATADTLVFDKTGTLTQACPRVAKVIPFGGYGRDTVLKISACLEEHFPHSVAKAIVRQAELEQLGHREEHAEPEYVIAHGISSTLHGERVLIGSRHFICADEGVVFSPQEEATIEAESEGYSTVFLASGGKLAGMICVEDPVRGDAKDILARLARLGLGRIIMLTGDSEAAARHACAQLGISEYYAGVLPEDKAGIVRRLRESGRTVIMVGDGINDSPALSAADVSVAMKDGSDLAREVADITLLSENLDGLPTLRLLSREMMARIDKNYRVIVGFNTGLLVCGAAGLIRPSTSAVLHNASTMLLCGMSMRPSAI